MSKKRSSSLIITTAVVLLISAVASLLYYLQTTEKSVYQDVTGILQDSAKGQVAFFRTMLDQQCLLLDTLNKAVQKTVDLSGQLLSDDLEMLGETAAFYRMIVADSKGQAWATDGEMLRVTDWSCFKKGMDGEYAIDNKDLHAFYLAVPRWRNGRVVGVLIAEYEKTALENAFLSNSFEMESYSFICDRTGRLILQANHSGKLNDGENIFRFFQQAQFPNGETLPQIQEQIEQMQTGTVSYQVGQEQRYAVYMPVGLQDWMIFNVLPGTALRAKTRRMTYAGVLTIVFVGLAAALLVCMILILERRNMRTALAMQRSAKESNERLHLAMENMTATIWDYDLERREIHQAGYSILQHGFDQVVHDVPDSLIACGFVHPDSAEAFRAMYQALFDGKPKVDGVFRVRTADRTGWWFESIRYINLFDEKGKPYHAIGIGQNVTDQQVLVQAAQNDALTNLLNHKATLEGIRAQLSDVSAKHVSALFMIDVDHFKQINDLLGHQAGDKLLVSVATVIKSIFRANDIVGRVGGDEFLAFICDAPDFLIIRKKAEQMLRAAQIQCGEFGSDMVLSVSVGVAVRHPKEALDSLYRRADIALYTAKKQGRNQCYFDWGETEGETLVCRN